MCWLLSCALMLVSTAPAGAQLSPRTGPSEELIRFLQTPVDTKDMQQPMTLKEVISVLHNKVAPDLSILVDQASFARHNRDLPDLYETQIKLPPYPKRMPLASLLRHVVQQIPIETGFVIRRGTIVIVPEPDSTLEKLSQQPVLGDYTQANVLTVMRDVADQAGLALVVDNRIEDNANIPVTLTLSNGINARDALRLLCDMAGLKLIDLPTAYYVTTPTNSALSNYRR